MDKINIYYNIINGLVYGKLWGGGEGAYSMVSFRDVEDIKKWKEKYKNNLNSLDAGMGFEEVLGAVFEIEVVEQIEIKGKIFKNKEYYLETIGELTEEQLEFLYSSIIEQ